MNINRIEIEGYRSYGEPQTLTFAPGLYLLTGENRDRGISSGAGKSTLFKALTTALFEECDDASIGDKSINVFRKDAGMRIAVEFDLDGTIYYVVYSRKHPIDGTDWKLFRWTGAEWEIIRGARLKDTAATLRDLLQMNYAQFTNQAYVPQRQVANFIASTDKERKAIFSNLLNLEECDQYLSIASQWRKQREGEIREVSGGLKVLETQLAESRSGLRSIEDRTRLFEQLADAQSVKVTLQGLLDEVEKDNDRLLQLMQIKTEREQWIARLNDASEALRLFREKGVPLPDEDDMWDAKKREGLKTLYTDLVKTGEETIIALTAETLRSRERIRSLEQVKTNCTVCDRTLSKDTKQDMLRTEKAIIRKCEDKLKQQHSDVAEWKKFLTNIQRAEYEIERHLEASERLLHERTVCETAISEVDARLSAIHDVVGNAVNWGEELAARKTELTQEWQDIVHEIAQLQQSIEQIDYAIGRVALLEQQVQAANEQVIRLTTDIAYMKRCEELIGDKGFRAYKIAECRTIFNNALADALTILTDGEMQATLVTEIPKADGKGVKSELDILVQDGEKSGIPIRHYSGGEQSLLSLSILRAFAELAAANAANYTNILLLDEPFAEMDNWSEERACKLLEKLRDSGKVVIVITNHQSVKERGVFDYEIRAVKEDGQTHLEQYDLRGDH